MVKDNDNIIVGEMKNENEKKPDKNPWATTPVKKGTRTGVKGTELYDKEHGTNFAKQDTDSEVLSPVKLNISQEIADRIELDASNPTREDPNISIDPIGDEKYFDCYVPEGYIISSTGVWKKVQVKIPKDLGGGYEESAVSICKVRVMVTGKFVNTDTGSDIVEISFLGDTQKEVIYVPLVALHGKQEWKEHVRKNDYGRLYILDEELNETLKFLREVQYANIGRHHGPDGTLFKSGEASDRTGWVDKDFKRFVVGDILYWNDYNILKTDNAVFMDNRNVEIAKKLTPTGSVLKWAEFVKPFLQYPMFRFAMYYAIGSIFLAPVNGHSSAFGIIGDTSIGKTFSMQLIASMFGNPSERGGLIVNSDTSMPALNAILTTNVDLPLFIDEIGKMPEDTRKALTYAIGNGQEALRSKTSGSLRSNRMIRCNAIITGEEDIVSEFTHNGAQVRAFSAHQRIIPEVDTWKVKNAERCIMENNGHILKLALSKYFSSKQENIKRLCDIALDRLYTTTKDALLRRKAEYFAVAEVGGILLESVFKDLRINKIDSKDVDPKAIVNEAWEEFVLGNPDIPLEVKALEKVYQLALSHPRNFLVGDQMPAKQHPDDVWGWWVYPEFMVSGAYEFLDLNKTELEKQLRLIGYDKPLGILQYWRNHNITVCNSSPNGKRDKDGGKPKLLTFSAYHYYQYNQPAVRKGIIRIRMDKIKELIEGDTEEEVVKRGLKALMKNETSTEAYIDPLEW